MAALARASQRAPTPTLALALALTSTPNPTLTPTLSPTLALILTPTLAPIPILTPTPRHRPRPSPHPLPHALRQVLSKNAIIKYQLIFRHLFHCKHVERQLSSSWLKQQATKGLTGVTACFSASYGLRQRMLHFLQNLEYYMMFEVLEPNWHVLLQKLGAARKLDELIAQHNGFLDKCLKVKQRTPTALPAPAPGPLDAP